jgi:hypothetical protein
MAMALLHFYACWQNLPNKFNLNKANMGRKMPVKMSQRHLHLFYSKLIYYNILNCSFWRIDIVNA